MKVFGVDISRYQADFDFSKAKAEGVRFAILKGGGADDGYYIDRKFERNYREAKKEGLPVGVYWFSSALSVEDAKKEAAYFYRNIIAGKQFELPVFIDVETSGMLSLKRSYLTTVVKTFCDEMEDYGCWVGIYSSVSVFKNLFDDDRLQAYTHWVAAWSKSCPYKKNALGFWQFGGETNLLRSNKVAGVVCDQDYMFRDFPGMIKAAGLNGFQSEQQAETKPGAADKPEGNKSVTQIAREVINGMWGNGAARKKRLAAAGYDPAAVQNEVNRLLGIGTKTPEQIAEEVIRGDWGNGIVRKARLRAAGYDPQEIQRIVNQMLA